MKKQNESKDLMIERQLSNILYHFTDTSKLYDILQNNQMISWRSAIDGQMKASDYPELLGYNTFSFTRMKNGNSGFQGIFNSNVRIQFDGFKLQQIRGKKEQFDFFSYQGYSRNNTDASTRQKERTYNSKGNRKNRMTSSEAEDRILIPNENGNQHSMATIPNISKYITRIDVYIEPFFNRKNLEKFRPYEDRINFYNNKKDFDFQTNNTVSLDELYKKAQNESKDLMIEHQLKVQTDNDPFNDYKPLLSKVLKHRRNEQNEIRTVIISERQLKLYLNSLLTD
jgi:hypothetical protein